MKPINKYPDEPEKILKHFESWLSKNLEFHSNEINTHEMRYGENRSEFSKAYLACLKEVSRGLQDAFTALGRINNHGNKKSF